MPDLEENSAYWNEGFHWRHGGDEWSDWWGGPERRWRATLHPRVERFLPARRLLEIAPPERSLDAVLARPLRRTDRHRPAGAVSTAETVGPYETAVGLNCFRQELVRWGEDHSFLNDCFTWIARADSKHDRRHEITANAAFMDEARQARTADHLSEDNPFARASELVGLNVSSSTEDPRE
jgi:hypothetical protein